MKYRFSTEVYQEVTVSPHCLKLFRKTPKTSTLVILWSRILKKDSYTVLKYGFVKVSYTCMPN